MKSESIQEIKAVGRVRDVVFRSVVLSLCLSRKSIPLTMWYIAISMFGYLIFEIKYITEYIGRCKASKKITIGYAFIFNLVLTVLFSLAMWLILVDTYNNTR